MRLQQFWISQIKKVSFLCKIPSFCYYSHPQLSNWSNSDCCSLIVCMYFVTYHLHWNHIRRWSLHSQYGQKEWLQRPKTQQKDEYLRLKNWWPCVKLQSHIQFIVANTVDTRASVIITLKRRIRAMWKHFLCSKINLTIKKKSKGSKIKVRKGDSVPTLFSELWY